jgi:hypothetical protein
MLSQLGLNSKEERCVSRVAEPTGVDAVRAGTADYHRATVLAFILCGLLTLTGLLVPLSLGQDPSQGVMEWRTLAAGGPMNSIITPDPADISRDRATLVTWWSPGQYLIPGIFTLLGIRLGTAFTITVGVSLLSCLLGWIHVAKHFALGPRTATLAVLFIATFRYSTLSFGIYNGGEILLQGITPWLILAGCRAPAMSALRAAGLVCLAIWIAFFAKLTGVMVASAALFAGAVEALIRLRRITAGMVGGAVGAILALGALYVAWFSRGTTPASGTGWSFRFGDVFFALAAPWGAGISWGDMLAALLRRSVLHGELATFDARAITGGDPSAITWFFLPPVLVFATVILKGWHLRANDANLSRLLMITACFYIVCAMAMSAIYLKGGDVNFEDRHLRSAGTLIFVCVLAVVGRLPQKSVYRFTAGIFCVFMALYGCISLAYRAWSTKQGEIDHYSRTRQPIVDRQAIEFAKVAFAREGRDSVFVLPSAEIACVFLPGARILTNLIEFESEAVISARTYRGRVPGRLYVIMPTRIAQSVKGTLLLKEFIDYPLDAWERHSFGSSTVFVQGEPAP